MVNWKGNGVWGMESAMEGLVDELDIEVVAKSWGKLFWSVAFSLAECFAIDVDEGSADNID